MTRQVDCWSGREWQHWIIGFYVPTIPGSVDGSLGGVYRGWR